MSGQNGPPGYPTPRGKAYYAAFRVVSDPVRHNSRVDKVKSFGIFIAVLCVTALIVGGAVLWVGPQLVGLAVFDDQRDQPYMILDFARGGSSEIMRTRYEEPLTGLVASEGGVFAGRYTMSHLLEGTRADEWSRLNRFHMAQAQDIAKVMTSSPRTMAGMVVPGGKATSSIALPTTFELRLSPNATASMASAAPRLRECTRTMFPRRI